MSNYNLKTPVGLKDYLLKTMEKKNNIETILKELFLNSGYNLIETPTLEYIDVFTKDMQDQSLYKLINKDGEVLALRSDVTKSISRVTSTLTKDFIYPQRFCYITNTFRYPKAYQGKDHEFTQAGIELIGCNGLYADFEVISLAVKALNRVLSDYKLYISSTEFINNYLDDLNISPKIKKEILKEIQNKNVVKIKKLLDKSEYETISLIIEAIGKKDLLIKIKDNIKSDKSIKSLEYLEKLYELLEKNKLEKNVYFDFSVLSFGNYYTGITLQGYTKGVGEPILEGGRYDNLISSFGDAKDACGFAINVNGLINKTKLTYERDITYVYSSNKEKLYDNLKDGYFASLDETLEDAFKYAAYNNIKKVIDLDNNKKYVLKEGEYVCQE